VSDALSCTDTLFFDILASDLAVSVLANPALCNGVSNGSIYLTTTGGIQPYGFSWQGFFENADSLLYLSPGQYTYVVTDSMNCQLTDTIEVASSVNLNLASVVVPEMFGLDGAIDLSVSGGATPYVYFWMNGEQSQDLNNLGSGWYDVLVLDNNGCQVQDTFFVDSELGAPLPATNLFKVLPNPFTDYLAISAPQIAQIEILNLQGAIVWQQQFASPTDYHEIATAHFANGGYYIRVLHQNGLSQELLVRIR
jgi:hypothetical protein